jgi:hypothetical protein
MIIPCDVVIIIIVMIIPCDVVIIIIVMIIPCDVVILIIVMIIPCDVVARLFAMRRCRAGAQVLLSLVEVHALHSAPKPKLDRRSSVAAAAATEPAGGAAALRGAFFCSVRHGGAERSAEEFCRRPLPAAGVVDCEFMMWPCAPEHARPIPDDMFQRMLGQFRYSLYVPSLFCVDHLR